jgi:hypothetical protein
MACHALWLASLAFLHTCAVTFATTAPRLSEAQNMASAWSPPLVRTSSQRDRDTSQVHTRSRLYPCTRSACTSCIVWLPSSSAFLSIPAHTPHQSLCRSVTIMCSSSSGCIYAVVYELLPTSAHIQSATIEVNPLTCTAGFAVIAVHMSCVG